MPSLAEMYSGRWQAVGYWAYLAGLAVASGAIIESSEWGVRVGCALLGLSLATLMLNVGSMLTHFLKPKLQPVVPKTSPVLKLA